MSGAVNFWANAAAGAETDWIEYTVADLDSKNPDYPNVRFRVNLSFLQSHYGCHYGTCPGVLITGADTDMGCCQIGVGVEAGSDFNQVNEAVKRLTPDDVDNYEQIREEGWYRKIPRKDREPDENGVREPMYHTRVNDRGCVLANVTGGSAGKPGCALHVLALREGLHPSETKPEICWQIPFAVMEEYDSTDWCKIVTVTATHGTVWGSESTDNAMMPGYWCLETPDAYQNEPEPVYISAGTTLRKMMGDWAYELLVQRMQTVRRRYPMPGEAANGGRKMLPLLVLARKKQWEEGDDKGALERSAAYLRGLESE